MFGLKTSSSCVERILLSINLILQLVIHTSLGERLVFDVLRGLIFSILTNKGCVLLDARVLYKFFSLAPKLAISRLVTKFASANLAAKFSIANLLNSEVVIYLS